MPEMKKQSLLFCGRNALQEDEAFGAAVEEHVDDAEVGDKAQLLEEDLIIRTGEECGIDCPIVFFRVDDVAEVVFVGCERLSVFVGATDDGLHIYQSADEAGERFVEVDEVGEVLFVERSEVVLVELVIRRGVVSRLDGVPMQVAPLAMVGDTYVTHLTFYGIGLDDGDGETDDAIGTADAATVAIGLFHIMVVLLQIYLIILEEFGEILYGREIGGRKPS
jgi:hypothetical protein